MTVRICEVYTMRPITVDLEAKDEEQSNAMSDTSNKLSNKLLSWRGSKVAK